MKSWFDWAKSWKQFAADNSYVRRWLENFASPCTENLPSFGALNKKLKSGGQAFPSGASFFRIMVAIKGERVTGSGRLARLRLPTFPYAQIYNARETSGKEAVDLS